MEHNNNNDKTVVLGFSGGVDSSVAALILKNQNYHVKLVFMRNWDSLINNDYNGITKTTNNVCNQEEEYNHAQIVAKQLNLPITRIDFIDEYFNQVFQPFLQELKKGLTPNPDCFCNRFIKFGIFCKWASKKYGSNVKISTGHYAKLAINGKPKLLIAKDKNKDQTYFLSQIHKNILSKLVFPLENLTKPMVRLIAKENNLSCFNKKDSTGICFIGERNFKSFIKNYLPIKQGNIIDFMTNTIIGSHDGYYFYTIGQRKGLQINHKMFASSVFYVLKKNVSKNELLVISELQSKTLKWKSCELVAFNYLVNEKNLPINCKARFRHRLSLVDVHIHWNDKHLDKLFLNINSMDTKFFLAPGQICALYDKNICLGGGIIHNPTFSFE